MTGEERVVSVVVGFTSGFVVSCDTECFVWFRKCARSLLLAVLWTSYTRF